MSDAIKPPVDIRTCMVLLLVSCTLKRPQDEARSQLTTPHYVQARTMTDNRTMTDKLPSLAACLGTFLLQPPVTSFVLFIHIFQFLCTLEFLCLFMYLRNIVQYTTTDQQWHIVMLLCEEFVSEQYLIDYILLEVFSLGAPQALTSSWRPFVLCTQDQISGRVTHADDQ